YTKDPVSNELDILEENNYYPFGLKHKIYGGIKKDYLKEEPGNGGGGAIRPGVVIDGPYNYKYQGQERQDELGLNWDSFKWRNYDYAIGRFMSIDPLSEKYAYQSHYNFSENRVVDARELEGLESISVHTASYAQADEFGGVYKGDGANRTAGTDPTASSRIYGRVDLDLGGKTANEVYIGREAIGSESHNTLTGNSTYSEASITSNVTKNGDTVTLDMHVSGNNDLVPGSPDIDVKPSLTMTVTPMEDGGKAVQITGQVTGDGFPSNETYITDQNGNGVLLGSSNANANVNTGPVTSLPGDNNRPMSTVDTTIYFDRDGNITGSSATGSW